MAKPTETPARGRRVTKTVATGLLVGFVVVVAFLAITAQTGFPGPGPLRRYKISDLDTLANKINKVGFVSLYSKTDDPADVRNPARVDWLRDRVVVPHGLCVDDGAHELSAAELAMIEGSHAFCGVASTGQQ